MADTLTNPPHGITVQELNPERWLQEYGDALFRYALRRLHNRSHAEDVLQETLLAALQARASYSGRATEKTWLTGILKHKVIDFIRKQVRELTVDDINTLSDTTAESRMDNLFDTRGQWIHPPQDWSSPDKALLNHQFVEAFGHCMRHLKPVHAQIFSMKELGGHSIDEICKELDITATNCSVMLYRARMGLRRCLELRWVDHGHEEPR